MARSVAGLKSDGVRERHEEDVQMIDRMPRVR